MKEDCVSAAVEIHCCSSDSEEEEEEVIVRVPTFPTKTEVTLLQEKKNDIEKIVKQETEEDEETEEEVEVEVEVEETEEEDVEEVETETEEVEVEKKEKEEEEEELYEVEINGIMYVINDDEDGTIYSYINEEVGDKIGEFKGMIAHIFEGDNKGVYDRGLCKFDF